MIADYSISVLFSNMSIIFRKSL